MICGKCGLDNASTELYCRRCGGKMKFSDVEATVDLKAKLETEHEDSTEAQTRQFLVLGICLFLFALTMKTLFAHWPVCYVVPGSAQSASYSRVQFLKIPAIKEEELPIPK